jgi:hypothetical protein
MRSVRLPSSRPTAPGHGWDSIAFSDEALHDMAVSQDTENLGQTGRPPLLADRALTQAKQEAAALIRETQSWRKK